MAMGCGPTTTVQSGETLTAIAERCMTTVDDLLRLNPQLTESDGARLREEDGSKIYPDEVIIVNEKGTQNQIFTNMKARQFINQFGLFRKQAI